MIHYNEKMDELLFDFYLYGDHWIKPLSGKTKCTLHAHDADYSNDYNIRIDVWLTSNKHSYISSLINIIYIKPNNGNIIYCVYDIKTQIEKLVPLIIEPKQTLVHYIFYNNGLKTIFDNYHLKQHSNLVAVNYFLNDSYIRKLSGVIETSNDNDLM